MLYIPPARRRYVTPWSGLRPDTRIYGLAWCFWLRSDDVKIALKNRKVSCKLSGLICHIIVISSYGYGAYKRTRELKGGFSVGSSLFYIMGLMRIRVYQSAT